jgi:NAD(P)-dependent dehydrogenase (short-subunit alcohol dehydrogenase family)
MTRILITGASDGLGRALAYALAERECQLVVHGRDAARLAEVAKDTGAQAIRADLSSLAEVRRLAAAVEGDLDVLPQLKRSAPARIVNVASIGQRPFDVDDPMMERGYDGTEAYRRAKLALIAYTFDLAEELAGTGVTANCLHPASLMPTTMVRQAGTGQIDSLERGLRSTLRLVVDPALAGVTGRYFDREREARALDQAYDLDFRKRLRALTESLTSARG